jgi:hypothetical protein
MPRASGSICFSPPIRRRPRLRLSTAAIGQINDKENFAFFAEGLLPLGINLAVIEYTMAPAVRLDRIVAEVRRSVRWLAGISPNTASTRTGYTSPDIRPAAT